MLLALMDIPFRGYKIEVMMIKYTKAEKIEALKKEELAEVPGKKPKLSSLKPSSKPR